MSKSNVFRPLLAHPNRSLAALYSQIEQQQKLLTLIRSVLPQPLQAHAVHCVIDRNKLIVYAESANWASQLRFYRTAILGAIAKMPNHSVSILQFKISEPIRPQTERPARGANLPGAASIADIRQNADACKDDPLASSLLRLSATLERLSMARRKDEVSE